MKTAIALSTAVLATAVAAAAVMVLREPPQPAGLPGELVYQRGTVTWRLQTADCKYDDLVDALIGDGKLGAHKAAIVQMGERTWSACWAQDIDSDVLLVDVTGARGFMPRNWFEEVKK